MDQVRFDKRAVLTSISYAMMELGKGRHSLHNVKRHLKEAINKLERFATSVGVSTTGPEPEVPAGWNPLMPFTTDPSVWALEFDQHAFCERRDLYKAPSYARPWTPCPIVTRPGIDTIQSWFKSAIEAGRATALSEPKDQVAPSYVH